MADRPTHTPAIGGIPVTPALAEGFDALREARWDAAVAFFAAACSRERTPEALEGLGLAASHAGDETVTFESREAAWELYRRQANGLGAARVAIALAVDCITFRGHIALANGWLRRAHSVIRDQPLSSEHGWLQLLEAEKALLSDNDSDRARMYAGRALELARQHADADLEANALAVQGIATVTAGLVQEGLSFLDEAATACLTGEVAAPWVVSAVMCFMMDACDRVRDWDRAQEWFSHVQRLAERWNDTVLQAQCRPHYAVVLTWHGAWDQAEAQLTQSIDHLMVSFKPMAVEGIVRLAELRWRQGRLDEAQALFEQVQHEPLAQLGRATLALELGDHSQALELVEQCLRRLHPSNRLERLPALEVYVRVCLALADCDRARDVFAELEEMLTALATRPARATVHLSMGLIAAAEGRPEEACSQFEDAIVLFLQSNAPFEAARARVELAKALLRRDRREEAVREATAGLTALEALGAQLEAERARAVVASAGTSDTFAFQHARVSGLTAREIEVLSLLASGLSNQQIAETLVISIRTVQRHVENIYAKTGARGRAAAAVFAATHDLAPPALP